MNMCLVCRLAGKLSRGRGIWVFRRGLHGDRPLRAPGLSRCKCRSLCLMDPHEIVGLLKLRCTSYQNLGVFAIEPFKVPHLFKYFVSCVPQSIIASFGRALNTFCHASFPLVAAIYPRPL